LKIIIKFNYILNNNFVFGDWGLGIGDWAIPNPQSPIPSSVI